MLEIETIISSTSVILEDGKPNSGVGFNDPFEKKSETDSIYSWTCFISSSFSQYKSNLSNWVDSTLFSNLSYKLSEIIISYGQLDDGTWSIIVT